MKGIEKRRRASGVPRYLSLARSRRGRVLTQSPCNIARQHRIPSCTVLAARSISRQRRNRSVASLRSRLSVSGERKIPVRSAWTDEGRNAEIGNCARGSPVDGSRMTGMWAPRPSMIARCLDETAAKSGQVLSPFSMKRIHRGETTRAV